MSSVTDLQTSDEHYRCYRYFFFFSFFLCCFLYCLPFIGELKIIKLQLPAPTQLVYPHDAATTHYCSPQTKRHDFLSGLKRVLPSA